MYIIHINDQETLADICCSMLRMEMVDEHLQYKYRKYVLYSFYTEIILYFVLADALESFGRIDHQLLQEVQEHLVFGAHYPQSDIMNCKASGDKVRYDFNN